ncbi:hypothetical protein SAMN05216285_4157 [Natrinema salifodinae]|uniref:Uncharacterized protein n=2 Tax=Halobacteriales TaxID=2235 RepID=A0A1I0QZG8_9EURY|nr:hypothetical protein SAMN05216285_4157 [Natrinema salifodinae]
MVEWSNETDSGQGTYSVSHEVYTETRLLTNSPSSVYFDDFSIDAREVTGRVTTQDGTAVANATVHVTGVNYDSITPGPTQSLEDRANELFDKAENPLPPTFDRSLNVKGRYISDKSEEVPLAYTREDIAVTPWQDNADLQPPKVVLPADEPVVFVPWNPDGDAGFLGDEYANQLPGKQINKGPVIAEQLGPDGSVTQTNVIPVAESAGGGLTDPSSLPYAETRLSPGIYRIYLQGDDAKYLISVGNPDQIAGALEDDLKDKAGDYTDRAKDIRQRFENNKFERETVQTNSTGYYSVGVGKATATVAVEAYKAPDVPVDPGSETHPRTQIREHIDTYGTNSSIYLPSKPTRYDAPTDSADVELREVSYTPFGNNSKFENRLANLENLLTNETQRLESALQQPDASREELENVYSELEDVSDQNDELRQRVEELLNRDRETQVDVTIDPDNATDAELRERIAALEQAVQEGRDTLPSDGTETTVGEDTVSAVARFPGELTKDKITVLAHHSNGTTKTVSEDYITLDTSAATNVPGNQIGTTAVHVDDFPAGDAANVQFEWITARPDGVGRATATANNPLVNADAPKIDSVRVSSLAPGPDDRVGVEINPGEDSSFRKLTSATVYGPDGVTIPTEAIENGRETGFVTNGQGTHTLELTYEDTEANEFTKTLRLGADTTDRPRPASVRAESGPTGVYALVGDGLADGEVSIAENGDISTSATVADPENPPSEIHVYTGTLDTDPTGDISARLVGEDGAALNQRAWVYIHAKATTDGGTYVYRNGNQPVTTGDGNQFGTVTHQADQTLIKTYTNANGEAQVTITQPHGPIDSTVEAARWQLRKYTAGFSGSDLIPFAGVVGLGLYTRRRHRNRGATQ